MLSLAARFFEDFSVGEKFITPARTVTETDIVNYCCLSGDFNQVHTNEEYARKTHFKTRVAPGALVYAISSGLRSRLGLLDGTALNLLGIDKARFPNPVKPGDTIHVEFELSKKEEIGKRDRGQATFKCFVLNQRREQVLTYEISFLLKRR